MLKLKMQNFMMVVKL